MALERSVARPGAQARAKVSRCRMRRTSACAAAPSAQSVEDRRTDSTLPGLIGWCVQVTKNILDSDKRRVIALQTEVIQREQFFLAGGTGIGVRLRHRVSPDIDWFTAKPFDATRAAQALAPLPEKPPEVTVQGPHTLPAYDGSPQTTFLRYPQSTAPPDAL